MTRLLKQALLRNEVPAGLALAGAFLIFITSLSGFVSRGMEKLGLSGEPAPIGSDLLPSPASLPPPELSLVAVRNRRDSAGFTSGTRSSREETRRRPERLASGALPRSPEGWLRSLAREAGLTFTEVSSQAGSLTLPSSGGRVIAISEVTLKITAHGTFYALEDFLGQLEEAPFPIHVPDLDVFFGEKEQVEVQARVLLLGFDLAPAPHADGLQVTLDATERHGFLLRADETVSLLPGGILDPCRLGPHSLVLSPRAPGSATLELASPDGIRRIPLTVRGPERFPSTPLEVQPSFEKRAGLAEDPALDDVTEPVPPPRTAARRPLDPGQAGLSPADSSLVFGPWMVGSPPVERPARTASPPPPRPPPGPLPAPAGEIQRIPSVSGIMRSGSGPVALLDGQPAGVGDAVGEYRVEEIEPDHLVLSRGPQKLQISLPRQ